MRIDTERLLNEPITILNKVSARDAGTASDSYYASVVVGTWNLTESKTVDSSGNVTVSEAVKVQFPSDAADYVPYADFAKDTSQEGSYTVSEGDYLIRGNIGLIGEITPKEAATASREHGGVEVRHFRDLRGNGAVGGLVGIARFASVIYMEAD